MTEGKPVELNSREIMSLRMDALRTLSDCVAKLERVGDKACAVDLAQRMLEWRRGWR